jgi:WhiB family redox-sensing transcriptional regulator
MNHTRHQAMRQRHDRHTTSRTPAPPSPTRHASTWHAPAWHHDAACAQVGGDWWFPESHEHIPASVFRICGGCTARPACLLFALSVDVLHGVWAGLVPAEMWELRQRVLDGEQAATVITEGLATGDSRRTTHERIAYRAAPWNPGVAELDHQTEIVAQWAVQDGEERVAERHRRNAGTTDVSAA